MAFCPNCGAQVTGSFCPNCGTAVSGAGPGTGAGTGYVPPSASGVRVQAAGLSENVASALCYLFGLVTGIIFLVISPYNRNKTIRFHAFQSIFASIGVMICSIILTIFIGILVAAHAWWSGVLIRRIFDLAVFVGWVYMMYTAYNKRKIKIPVVGDLAQKQA
jgi:uncharacterized membrane protein